MTPQTPSSTDWLDEILNEVLKEAAIRRGSGGETLRADLIEAKQAILSHLSQNYRSVESIRGAIGQDDKLPKGTWELDRYHHRNDLRQKIREALNLVELDSTRPERKHDA